MEAEILNEVKNQNDKISKVDSIDLLEEINLFEGKVYYLTKSVRSNFCETNVFNFREYYGDLIKLLEDHKKHLFRLKH